MNAREQVEAPLALIQQSAYAALDEYEKHGAATPCLDSRIPHPLDNQRNTIDLWGIIRNLEGACDQLCCTLAPPAHTIANRAQDHYWACIRFATKSRIVNTLADHPKGLHVRDLAEMVGIGQDKLTTILRLLAAKHCFLEGMFSRFVVSCDTAVDTDHDVFANDRLSLMLPSSQSISGFVELFTNDSHRGAYTNLCNILTDPEYERYSYDPRKSSLMHFVKDKFQGILYDVFKADPERRSVSGLLGM